MKIFQYIAAVIMLSVTISCSRNSGDSTNPDKNGPQYFKTQSEAVLKGKNDLLTVLRSAPDFQFTIDPQLLQKAQPGITVKYTDIDFDRLLKEENPTSLNQLVKGVKSNINTLMVDNNVITVIQTSNSEKGWAVTAVADAALANDLDEVLNALPNSQIEEVTLYEIENLQAFIYQIKTTDGDVYFSKYDGFTLKQSTSIEQIYPVLHGDAQLFDRKYGNEIKLKKLVK